MKQISIGQTDVVIELATSLQPVEKFDVSNPQRRFVVLTRDISFLDWDNNPINLLEGETIFVDEETMTGFAHDMAFEISAHSYTVLQ